MSAVGASVAAILSALGEVTPQPTGPLPLESIRALVAAAEGSVEGFLDAQLQHKEREYDLNPPARESTDPRPHPGNPFQHRRHPLSSYQMSCTKPLCPCITPKRLLNPP